MTIIRLPVGIYGTRLPDTPTTGNPFRYQGPDAEITQEAIARVKALHERFPGILGPYVEGKRAPSL